MPEKLTISSKHRKESKNFGPEDTAWKKKETVDKIKFLHVSSETQM